MGLLLLVNGAWHTSNLGGEHLSASKGELTPLVDRPFISLFSCHSLKNLYSTDRLILFFLRGSKNMFVSHGVRGVIVVGLIAVVFGCGEGQREQVEPKAELLATDF